MKNIHTEIEINASPEKVWSILADFEKYPEWNPFITSIKGNLQEGAKLNARIELVDSKAMTFKPTCLKAEHNSELRWLGHLLVKGIFDGEHIFKMKAIEGGKTKFVQAENFSGLLVPMMWKSLEPKTLKSFGMMNKALKERAEA